MHCFDHQVSLVEVYWEAVVVSLTLILEALNDSYHNQGLPSRSIRLFVIRFFLRWKKAELSRLFPSNIYTPDGYVD